MPVRVMGVRHVGVNVARRAMRVRVAVRPVGHHGVRVLMMAVVVPVRVLVLERVVDVRVGVPLRQVQDDAGQHQQAAGAEPRIARAVAERKGDSGADEWREGEHRAGARRAECPLRQQVEAQAEAIAGGADGKQRQRRRGPGGGSPTSTATSARRARRALPWPSRPDRGHAPRARATARCRGPRPPSRRATARRPEAALSSRVAAEDQQHASGNEQCHRDADAAVDRFAVEATREQGGEHDFEREHQRRAGRARVLQAPGQRHRVRRRRRRQPRRRAAPVAANEPCLAPSAAGQSAPTRAAPA